MVIRGSLGCAFASSLFVEYGSHERKHSYITSIAITSATCAPG